MKLFKNVILVIILSYLIIPSAWAKTDVKQAVVKVYTVYNEYSYYEPWQMVGQDKRSGSGVIIKGNSV